MGQVRMAENEKKASDKKPVLAKENVTELLYKKFLNVYDLSYRPGSHYYTATRRDRDNLAATKSVEELRRMQPDAVTCVLILKVDGKEPRLVLTEEFRYPVGQFLLSIPAGLLDAEDLSCGEPVFQAARRELQEETGIFLEEQDEIKMVNPLLFSSPGMTDESNAIVQITLNRKEEPAFSQSGAVGGECFDGFRLVNRKEAMELLKSGTDEDGIFYSCFTWVALMCFVTGIWSD